MSNTQLAGGVVPGGSPETPGAGGRVLQPIAPFAVQSDEGTALETPSGDVVIIKASTRQTNGSLTVMELVVSPKNGPALHTHLREDELWYVLEGWMQATGTALYAVEREAQRPLPRRDAGPGVPS